MGTWLGGWDKYRRGSPKLIKLIRVKFGLRKGLLVLVKGGGVYVITEQTLYITYIADK